MCIVGAGMGYCVCSRGLVGSILAVCMYIRAGWEEACISTRRLFVLILISAQGDRSKGIVSAFSVQIWVVLLDHQCFIPKNLPFLL